MVMGFFAFLFIFSFLFFSISSYCLSIHPSGHLFSMLITVLYNDQFLNFDLNPQIKLSDLYKLLSFETTLDISLIDLFKDGNSLGADANKTLHDLSLYDNDLLILRPKSLLNGRNNNTFSSNGGNSMGITTDAITSSTANPSSRTTFPRENSSAALLASTTDNSPSTRRNINNNSNDFDPFDVETQRRIEQHIRNENIHNNLAQAFEDHPESFTSVSMLFVPIHINGHLVKAFVDCGAQATIMSQSCARRCKYNIIINSSHSHHSHVLLNFCSIERLIDERWNGIAKGVGEGRIIGRIHAVEILIGEGVLITCALNILDKLGSGSSIGSNNSSAINATTTNTPNIINKQERIEFLLGLDMLKRYQV